MYYSMLEEYKNDDMLVRMYKYKGYYTIETFSFDGQMDFSCDFGSHKEAKKFYDYVVEHHAHYVTDIDLLPLVAGEMGGTIYVTENCPYCEYEIDSRVKAGQMVVKCKNCGKKILLCNLCNMDEVDCSKCKWEKEASNESTRNNGKA